MGSVTTFDVASDGTRLDTVMLLDMITAPMGSQYKARADEED
jgi:hypothetical protein